MKTALIACLTAVLASNAAGATTVSYVGLDDLVGLADGIVAGTVTGSVSRRGPDKEIYTFITFADLNVIKGSIDGPSLTLRFQGGAVEDEALELEGSPRFDLHHRVILFVRGNGKDIVPIVGWTQGVFRIKANADAVENVVDHDGNRVLSTRGALLLKERKHPSSVRIAGGPALTRQSRAAKGSPGVGDGGSKSATLQMTLPEAATELALTAPEVVDSLRQRVSAQQRAGGSAAALQRQAEGHSIDGFEGIAPIDDGALDSDDADREAVALPQRHR
jgi:hypothetical protein